MKCIDEKGNKYGRLTVIERVNNDKAGNAKALLSGENNE